MKRQVSREEKEAFNVCTPLYLNWHFSVATSFDIWYLIGIQIFAKWREVVAISRNGSDMVKKIGGKHRADW